jgi:catechol 2,3-dioxygenase-like lactoylglutathione lyase family enzyme
MTDRVTPTMPSRDLAATSAFYDRLGFRELFRDASWLIVARGPLQLEFFPHPTLDPWTNHAGCCLRVGDARALHDAFGAAGLSADPRSVPRLTPPARATVGLPRVRAGGSRRQPAPRAGAAGAVAGAIPTSGRCMRAVPAGAASAPAG